MNEQDEFTPMTPDPPYSPGTPEPPDLDVDARAISRKVDERHANDPPAGDAPEDDTEGEEPPD